MQHRTAPSPHWVITLHVFSCQSIHPRTLPMCLIVAIGADFARQRSTDVDSVTAGQITANFIRRLSNVLQIISEQNYDYVYRPHLA